MATAQEYRQALVVRRPFWEALSSTTIKQRLDQILAAPNGKALVQELSPVEYILLLKEASELRSLLLELAHPKQIRTVLDLDCWDKDTLRSVRVLEWLEELQRSGSEVLVQALQVMDMEMLIIAFRKYIRVHAALPTEEEPEPSVYDEALVNELYRVEFVEPDSTRNEPIRRLLHFLRAADLDFYHGLMQGVMWGQDSELEEWAYRWKSGRLQDEGFPDYYDAAEEIQRLADIAQPLPIPEGLLQAPGQPESAEESGLIPSYAWSLTPAGSLLAQALRGAFAVETQERLCWEMVYLCNRELVVDQVDFADAAAVRTSLLRVHAYLNMGIEYLSGYDPQQLVPVLTTRSLKSLYQIGFTLSLSLHRRALRLQTHLDRSIGVRRALPGLARRVIDGLLYRPPQFFEGLVQPGETGFRDFLSMRDITVVDPLLTCLENDPAYHLPRSLAYPEV
jgi:hypothetical protein